LILEQSTNAQGDFARTSDGLANSTRIMKAQFQDALASLGTNLLPVVLKVVQGLNKMLEAFNNAPPYVQKAILGFMLFLAVLGPILTVVGTVISTISGLVSIAGGLGISMGTVAGAAGAAGTALVGVGAAALSVLGQILLLAAGPVILYLAFKNNFMGITTTAQQLWFLIKFYFAEGWKWLVNAVKGGGTIVMDWFKRMLERVVQYFRNINWGELGKNMMMGVVNGILGGIPAIIAAAAKAGQAALQAMRKALDSHSPSREFMKIGVDSGDGYKIGLMNSVNPNTISKMMAKPVQQMTTAQNTRNTINLSSGLTLRDVDELMSRKIDGFTRQLNRSLGGA
jgi:hypothetical protein